MHPSSVLIIWFNLVQWLLVVAHSILLLLAAYANHRCERCMHTKTQKHARVRGCVTPHQLVLQFHVWFLWFWPNRDFQCTESTFAGSGAGARLLVTLDHVVTTTFATAVNSHFICLISKFYACAHMCKQMKQCLCVSGGTLLNNLTSGPVANVGTNTTHAAPGSLPTNARICVWPS